MPLTVSTIVPVYNGADRLRDTIESLLAQTYAAHEIVLINDGSTDASCEVIAQFADHPQVIALAQDNAGVAAARNTGIEAASGDLLAFCDQDDLWMPNKLEAQVPLFRDGVGLVYSGVEFRYSEMSRNSVPQGAPASVESMLIRNTICSCSAVVRKDLVEQVGLFEADRALMGVDDWHLWLRLLSITESAYTQDVLAVHVIHGNNYSFREKDMLSASLACLEKLRDSPMMSEMHLDLNEATWSVYEHYATNFVYYGEFDEAVRCFWEQTKLHPLGLPVFLKLAFFGSLPNSLLRAIQQFKRSREPQGENTK